MDGKKYDYKEAYNKNLTPKARLHYLENARHDQDAKCPSCGSPLHSNCGSPAKQVGIVDPLTQQQQVVQPVTNVTPAGSSLVNPFNPQAQAVASGVFGNQQMKQNAVGAPAMYKDGSPLEGNAFIGAKMAAEKAGKDTFEVGGKTFPVK
jgi:hypothetical protein